MKTKLENSPSEPTTEDVLGVGAPANTWKTETHPKGPPGKLPFTAEFLTRKPKVTISQ